MPVQLVALLMLVALSPHVCRNGSRVDAAVVAAVRAQSWSLPYWMISNTVLGPDIIASHCIIALGDSDAMLSMEMFACELREMPIRKSELRRATARVSVPTTAAWQAPDTTQ